MSAYQDASVKYNQFNFKICDFFSLGAFGCFLTGGTTGLRGGSVDAWAGYGHGRLGRAGGGGHCQIN